MWTKATALASFTVDMRYLSLLFFLIKSKYISKVYKKVAFPHHSKVKQGIRHLN